MRNFSMMTTSIFLSYDVNGGEYVSDVETDEILSALAIAFESRKREVRKDFETILLAWNPAEFDLPPPALWDADYVLAPSEVSVLIKLVAFLYHVGKNAESLIAKPASFVYHNLNTGMSVIAVWAKM